MRNYHLRRNSKWCPAINLEQLYTLIPEETRQKYENDKEKAVVIDVVRKVINFYLSVNHLYTTELSMMKNKCLATGGLNYKFVCCQ